MRLANRPESHDWHSAWLIDGLNLPVEQKSQFDEAEEPENRPDEQPKQLEAEEEFEKNPGSQA